MTWRCGLVHVWVGLVAAACGGGAEAPAASPPAVAQVQTAPLERRSLQEQLTLYGTVVPGPESQHSASAAFECVVRRIHVRVGQSVVTGEPLIDVEPSPDAVLSLQQARTDAASAAETLASVQARFASRLATQSEVAAAQRDARDAQLRVRSLVVRGSVSVQTLAATGPSVVTAVHVTEGALAPAGAALVDLDLSAHREVHFGVEVEDVAYVAAGAPIRVRDLGRPPRVEIGGVLRATGESVNEASRLVDLFASLPDDPGLLLGQRVAGTLSIDSGPVFVVPRSALVPEPDRMVLYTVTSDEVAHAHAVRVGLENDEEVEVLAPDLEVDMRVVVSGASVLTDGMSVAEAAQ